MARSGNENSVVFASNADFSGSSTVSNTNGITADNQVWLGRSATVGSLSQIDVMTLTAGPGISLTRSGAGVPGTPGTLTIANTGSMTDLHDSRFIVSAGGSSDGANYTTIASAITAATSAGGVQTIMIQPGTYTENLTLPANINLVAHVGDHMTPTVTIVGKITCSDTGSRSISGIRLQTNSDFCLVVSGSVATVVRLTNCRIQATNNTAISFTSSSSSSLIDIEYCSGDITTTGIAIVSSSSAGRMNINYSRFRNTGNSTTNSTFSSGDFQTRASGYESAWTFSSSAGCDFNNSVIYTVPLNITCLTINSTSGSGNNCYFCRFDSGSASAISVGASATLRLGECNYNSSNTNVLTGSGSVILGTTTFFGSSLGINVSSVTVSPQGYKSTFTPNLRFGGNSVGIAYTTRTGIYYKIGSLVYFCIRIFLSSKGSSTGQATVSGLPFASANDGNTIIGSMACGAVGNTAGSTQFYWELPPNSSIIVLANTGNLNLASLTNTEFGNSSQFTLSGFYWTA